MNDFPFGKILLDGLKTVMVIENAETNLFRQEKELRIEAGSWVQFFDSVLNAQYNKQQQTAHGLTWERGSNLINSRKMMRFARWIKVMRGEDIFVALLVPHEYKQNDHDNTYIDYRFVVATNNEDMLTTVILYQETILAPVPFDDEPWFAPAS